MSYYPESDNHIREKFKVELDLSNYAAKKELEYDTGIDISDLAAKKDFVALKAEVNKRDINKLTNVPTSLNNLKTKVDNLDVGKLKTVPLDLKKLSDVVDNEVVKYLKFNTLKAKVNSIEKKILASTLIHINQYNTDKQNLKKKIATGVDIKISEAENKIPDNSSLVTTTVLNTKVSEVENKIPDDCEYITTQEFNKLTSEKFAAILKQADLVSKTDFDNRLTSFNKRNQTFRSAKETNSLIAEDYNFFFGRMHFITND